MALPVGVEETINKKAVFIDNAVDVVNSDMTPTQRRIFKAIQKQLKKYPSKDGFFIFSGDTSAKATALTLEIEQLMVDAIQGSQYPGNVGKFLKDYNGIIDFNISIHEELNGIGAKEIEDLVNPFLRQQIATTTEQLTGAGMNEAVIKPVQESLQNNVIAGADIQDAENTLRGFIEGDAERLGALDRHVSQISRDAIHQFDGLVNAQIADEFGLDAYNYVGSLIDDSRPQCVRWVRKKGGVLPIETLPAEIRWANNSGTGFIPGTNVKNFPSLRGGYNCRHQAIPFKMSEEERANLGL